jgi:hypothetical protein
MQNHDPANRGINRASKPKTRLRPEHEPTPQDGRGDEAGSASQLLGVAWRRGLRGRGNVDQAGDSWSIAQSAVAGSAMRPARITVAELARRWRSDSRRHPYSRLPWMSREGRIRID